MSPLVTRLAVDAPCPVLVVDEKSAAPRRGDDLAHILVAVNFLPASLVAADHAFGRLNDCLEREESVAATDPIDPVDTHYPWKRSI